MSQSPADINKLITGHVCRHSLVVNLLGKYYIDIKTIANFVGTFRTESHQKDIFAWWTY